MQISSVSSTSQLQDLRDNSKFTKVKQAFEDIGSALESGSISDAQTALATLQENAPAEAKNDKNNPMNSKIEALSEALESGDLDAAKDAYADIKQTMSQKPQGAPPAGAAPSGSSSSSSTSSTSSSSSSNKVYDAMDTDKDGEVTYEEEQAYKIKHPEEEDKYSALEATKYRGIDTLA
jgi:hypothetical protein